VGQEWFLWSVIIEIVVENVDHSVYQVKEQDGLLVQHCFKLPLHFLHRYVTVALR